MSRSTRASTTAVFDGQVHFPDYRIEYEVDGREHHEEVERFTTHYRGAHGGAAFSKRPA